MSSQETRNKIMEAATMIVRDQGVARLTIDEAARVSGLSKGGVLYHFPSKDALVQGMIDRLCEQLDEEDLRHYAQEPEGPYRWLRASVRTAFNPTGPACDSVGGALLAAVTVNPELMHTARQKYETWLERSISDSPDQGLARLITMALDGYYFANMLGLKTYSPEETAILERYLFGLLTKHGEITHE